MAYTWLHYDWYQMNKRNPLTWHFEMPLWPFLQAIQPPQPPKLSGSDAVDLIVLASSIGKRLAAP